MPPPLTALKTLTVLSTAKANAAAAEMQMIQDTSLNNNNNNNNDRLTAFDPGQPG